MKFFRTLCNSRRGFSLVEASISIGIVSLGFVTLVPMLGLSLSTARHSRDTATAAQIAQTIEAGARGGLLATGSGYRDGEGQPCSPAQARFRTQVTATTLAGDCTRLAIQVTAVDSPDRPSSYAVVLPPP